MRQILYKKKRQIIYVLTLAISLFFFDKILFADNVAQILNPTFHKANNLKIDSAHIVYGQVYDSISKKPIADVKIYFRGSADTTTTTEYSGYRLWMQDNILRSQQTLVFQHKDYATKEITIITIDYPISLDINLIKSNKTKKRREK